MTMSWKTRCKKLEDSKNLEVLEPLSDEKPEELSKEVNEEVTKEKMLKLRIFLCEKNSTEKLAIKLAIETE